MIQLNRLYRLTVHSALLLRVSRIRRDSAGNEIQREIFNGDGELVRKIVVQYDALKRIKSKNTFGRGNISSGKILYRYAPQGPLQSMDFFDAAGRLVARRLWKYDADGHVKEYRKTDQNGQSTQLIRFTYDPRGAPLRERHYDSHGHLKYYKLFFYDDHVRETELRILTAEDRLKVRRTSVYDEAGRLAQHDWYNEKHVLQRHERFEYFSNGRLRFEETEDVSDGNTFTRLYDETGNLLRQQHFQNARLVEESLLKHGKRNLLSLRLKYSFPSGNRKLSEVQTTNRL